MQIPFPIPSPEKLKEKEQRKQAVPAAIRKRPTHVPRSLIPVPTH